MSQQVGYNTRILIQSAQRKTGFRPNLFTSNLKRNSKVIGIIIPSITDPFYMQLVSRISTIAEMSGYFIYIAASNES